MKPGSSIFFVKRKLVGLLGKSFDITFCELQPMQQTKKQRSAYLKNKRILKYGGYPGIRLLLLPVLLIALVAALYFGAAGRHDY